MSIMTNSIEILSINDVPNIINHKWTVLNTTLMVKSAGFRSIVNENQILIIGGINGAGYAIQVIDAISHQLTSQGNLTYGAHSLATIIADGYVYVFGGYSFGDTDNWQYGLLLSISSTVRFLWDV